MTGSHGYDADELVARMRVDEESDWLTRLLRNISNVPLVPEEILTQLVGSLRGEGEDLTPAETQVLQAASFGMTPKMIAETYGLSVHTVNDQLKSARLQLRAKDRTHACCIALREGRIR